MEKILIIINKIKSLISSIELDLSNGLNIITGETGAGKSILINAIDIAFGAKSGKELIKTGVDINSKQIPSSALKKKILMLFGFLVHLKFH